MLSVCSNLNSSPTFHSEDEEIEATAQYLNMLLEWRKRREVFDGVEITTRSTHRSDPVALSTSIAPQPTIPGPSSEPATSTSKADNASTIVYPYAAAKDATSINPIVRDYAYGPRLIPPKPSEAVPKQSSLLIAISPRSSILKWRPESSIVSFSRPLLLQ